MLPIKHIAYEDHMPASIIYREWLHGPVSTVGHFEEMGCFYVITLADIFLM